MSDPFTSQSPPQVQPQDRAVWLVVPCAGVGSRVGADIPKQYLPLAGSTVLETTLSCFLTRADVKGVVLAVAKHDEWVKSLPLINEYQQKIFFAEGGKERSDSVASALEFLNDNDLCQASDLIAVHDAARPCVSQNDINAVFTAAYEHASGALLAVPSFNTLKQAKQVRDQSQGVFSEQTIDRSIIWQAYTPQVFSYALIQSALSQARVQGFAITDDASAVELLGQFPLLVEGSASNIKITQSDDLALAEFYLKRPH